MRKTTECPRETTPAAVGASPIATLKQALMGPNSARVYGISITVGALLAISGAFQDRDAPLLIRFAYWLPIMLVGAVMGSTAAAFVITVERWAQSQLLSWGLLTVLVGAPMTLVVWLVDSLMAGQKLELHLILLYAPSTFMVSAAMAAILTFLHQVPAQSHGATQIVGHPPIDAKPPRFLDRLPMKLRGAQILAVSAEDHYLRVHSSRGSDMILMRLSDAIIELDGIEGSQVHRSWWVARDAIESVSRGEGKAIFTLKGGIQAPVSRTFAKALREQGWY